VRFWDPVSGKLLLEHDAMEPVWSVACSPLGRWVAASVHDGVLVFEVTGGKQ
jgi:hypothetical protein